MGDAGAKGCCGSSRLGLWGGGAFHIIPPCIFLVRERNFPPIRNLSIVGAFRGGVCLWPLQVAHSRPRIASTPPYFEHLPVISGSFSSVLYRFPIGNLLLIAQEDAGQVAENGGGEVAADAPFWLQMVSQPMFPIGVLLMLFYFLVMAPEKRRRAEEAKRLAGIKKNDPVVTSGGLHGTVVLLLHERCCSFCRCPVAGEMPGQVAEKVAELDNVGLVQVTLVWDPPWAPERMSEDAKLALDYGF